MVSIKKIAVMFLLAAAGSAIFFLYLQSDERKVKKRFERLSELVAKEGGEPVILMAQRARGVGGLFAENCTVHSSDSLRSGSYTPEQVTSHAASVRGAFQKLDLSFYDLGVTFPEENLAQVKVTGILSGVTKHEEVFNETHELDIELKKVDEEWYFSSIRAVQVLER